MSDSHSFHVNYGLNEVRHDLCGDLVGDVAEVSLDVFKSSVLPILDPTVFNKLENAVAHLVSNNRWISFPKDPAEYKEVEDKAFANLPTLINDIAMAVAPEAVLGLAKDDVKWKAGARPTKTFQVENNLHATYKPDGSGMLLRRNKTVAFSETNISGVSASPEAQSTHITVTPTATVAPATDVATNVATTTDTTPTINDLSRQVASDAVFFYELKKAYNVSTLQDVSRHATIQRSR